MTNKDVLEALRREAARLRRLNEIYTPGLKGVDSPWLWLASQCEKIRADVIQALGEGN